MTIRTATRDDLIAFGAEQIPTMRAIVAVTNGAVEAIAGVFHDPRYLVAFSRIKPSIRQRKRDIMRFMKHSKELFHRGRFVVAVADPEEENSERFLEHMGFRYIETSANGRVYALWP